MLDARFLHLYFFQSLDMPQCGLAAVADLFVSKTATQTKAALEL